MSNLLPHERERIPTGEPHSEERRQQLEDLKSGKIGKMPDRYVHLDCFGSIQQTGEGSPISISTKLDDEGVVIDVWCNDECVASTYKLYSEMGIEVKKIEDE